MGLLLLSCTANAMKTQPEKLSADLQHQEKPQRSAVHGAAMAAIAKATAHNADMLAKEQNAKRKAEDSKARAAEAAAQKLSAEKAAAEKAAAEAAAAEAALAAADAEEAEKAAAEKAAAEKAAATEEAEKAVVEKAAAEAEAEKAAADNAAAELESLTHREGTQAGVCEDSQLRRLKAGFLKESHTCNEAGIKQSLCPTLYSQGMDIGWANSCVDTHGCTLKQCWTFCEPLLKAKGRLVESNSIPAALEACKNAADWKGVWDTLELNKPDYGPDSDWVPNQDVQYNCKGEDGDKDEDEPLTEEELKACCGDMKMGEICTKEGLWKAHFPKLHERASTPKECRDDLYRDFDCQGFFEAVHSPTPTNTTEADHGTDDNGEDAEDEEKKKAGLCDGGGKDACPLTCKPACQGSKLFKEGINLMRWKEAHGLHAVREVAGEVSAWFKNITKQESASYDTFFENKRFPGAIAIDPHKDDPKSYTILQCQEYCTKDRQCDFVMHGLSDTLCLKYQNGDSLEPGGGGRRPRWEEAKGFNVYVKAK